MIKVDTTRFRQETAATKKLLEEYRGQEIDMAYKYLGVIRSRTPVATMVTQDAWTVHMETAPDRVHWEISPDGREDIVTFLEYGTKPHVIIPTTWPFGVLVFDVGGDTIFTKHVHHPGTKPLGLVRLTQDEIDKEGEERRERLHATIRSIWGHK